MRTSGVCVKTVAVHLSRQVERMTPAEQADAAGTYYITDTSPARVAACHMRLLLSSPRRYLKMLGYTLGLRRKGPVPFLKLAAYFAEAGLLLDWLRRERVNHLHVHFANPAATVAMIATSQGQFSFSLSVHGPDAFDNVPGNLLVEKITRAAFVRCISHFCRSQLMRLVPFNQWPKLHIVRCGVDTDVFGPRPKPKNAVPEIVCLGRLVPAKGQHVLLQACRALREKGAAFHLTFIGDGPDRKSLDALCREWGLSDSVAFTGAVGQDEVCRRLEIADIMVLPSFAEGLPVVLMEAMAKEIPCISSRIMGIPELIEDGVNGFLTAPSDVEGIAEGIAQLLKDAELRRRLGCNARKTVCEHYDIETNCRRMGELLAECAHVGACAGEAT